MILSMNMKSKIPKIILYIIVLCGSIFCSCKKEYPEDPKRTTKDVNKRINGEWQATKLTIYGEDKLHIIDSLNVGRYRFEFYKSAHGIYSKYSGNFVAIDKQENEIHPDTAFQNCSFTNNLEHLYFLPIGYTPKLRKPLVFFPGYFKYTHLNIENWKILKLTYKEMKLESEDYEIIVEMKKVKELKLL